MPAKPRPQEGPARVSDREREGAPEAARLDLGTLERRLGYFVRRLQVEIFQHFIAALASLSVRPAQYSVMVLIARNPGQPQAAIARALGIERAALAKMLHEFERRGWTQRLPSVRDGRSHALFLTREGEKALARMEALTEGHERHLERRLGGRRYRELLALLKDFG
jgi:DNA-binding MarR family transcriptional regulator